MPGSRCSSSEAAVAALLLAEDCSLATDGIFGTAAEMAQEVRAWLVQFAGASEPYLAAAN